MYLGTRDDMLYFAGRSITIPSGVDAHGTERSPRPFVSRSRWRVAFPLMRRRITLWDTGPKLREEENKRRQLKTTKEDKDEEESET